MRRLVLVVALLLALAGCSLFEDDDPGPAPVPIGGSDPIAGTPKALRAFYLQQLRWHECRKTDQCAELSVPLDYKRPKGRRITLSVIKVPSASPQRRIGALVVNPGGPGGSGIDYATRGESTWGKQLLAAYDLVGFDPRGVGESTPVRCQSDAELDAFVAADPDPDTLEEQERYDELNRAFYAGCMEKNPGLARHLSTVEAARDLDILRAVLGEGRLSYFGASYGTFLGGTYADLFPQRVGRMVLDGAIDPSTSSTEMSLVQAKGFETALRAYVAICLDEGDCYLGDSVDAGTGRVRTFLDQLDVQPIQGSGGRDLTEGLAVYGIFAPLYDRAYWGILDNALAAGLRGAGAQLLALSDAYTRRGPYGYIDNALQVLPIVNCLDHDDPVPADQIPALVPRFEEASPTFGRIFAAGLSSCEDWSVQSGKGPTRLTAKGSAPILVIGTTRDPATPLRWAEGLAEQLDNAVLIRRDGDGHTGYHSGNDCVDTAVEKYLTSGQVPEDPTDC
jgi:pimeloyl-ACP methyl ester carboxylesterase